MAESGDLTAGWRQCARKIAYSTRKLARDHASRFGKRDSKVYRVYECAICGGFHLTTERR